MQKDALEARGVVYLHSFQHIADRYTQISYCKEAASVVHFIISFQFSFIFPFSQKKINKNKTNSKINDLNKRWPKKQVDKQQKPIKKLFIRIH